MVDLDNRLKNKRIMVTGAAGFVGSRLVKTLLDNEVEVIALVDENDPLDRIDAFRNHSGLHLVRCSLDDMNTLLLKRSKWGEIDYLVHLRLKVSSGQNFLEQSTEDIRANLLPTINLIKALDNSIRGICFASSVSVYGNPAGLHVKESDTPVPLSSYATTKLAMENYLRSYGTANNIPVTILRYSTIYGPGELNHRAIPNFISNIAAGKPPVITGDGSEIRDYVYVDDVVRATIRAIIAGTNQVFNIGSGQGHSTLEIAREVMRLYAVEMTPNFTSRVKTNVNIVCDISAAREALAYSPQISLEEGLKQEIDWFKNNMQNSIVKPDTLNLAARKTGKRAGGLFSYALLKDIIDRVFSLVVLTVLSPLMLLIMIGIRIDSHGRSIFSQERVGKDGSRFTVYKFRTMYADNDDSKYKEYLKKYILENAPYRVDENGQEVFKVDDNSATKFGMLLRKTNLDELPQFINVLKGDMSVIGPRPDVPYAVEMYRDWHKARLQAKPGITGLWQVCGRKGLSFDEMAKLDIEYIEKQSFLFDLTIAVKTILTMAKMDGS